MLNAQSRHFVSMAIGTILHLPYSFQVAYLELCAEIYRLQKKANRHFRHEHPAGAASWDLEVVKRLINGSWTENWNFVTILVPDNIYSVRNILVKPSLNWKP